MLSEVDINDVSISPDEIENIESDEGINIDKKIKRSREEDNRDNKKEIVLKKFLDENGREYPLTGGKTGMMQVYFLMTKIVMNLMKKRKG
jgi:mannitol-specific phosphotransferase system IIBC component